MQKPTQSKQYSGKPATRLSRRNVGAGEWELIESTWNGPPDSVRVVKRGPWSVLKEHAALWFKALVGSNGVGDLE